MLLLERLEALVRQLECLVGKRIELDRRALPIAEPGAHVSLARHVRDQEARGRQPLGLLRVMREDGFERARRFTGTDHRHIKVVEFAGRNERVREGAALIHFVSDMSEDAFETAMFRLFDKSVKRLYKRNAGGDKCGKLSRRHRTFHRRDPRREIELYVEPAAARFGRLAGACISFDDFGQKNAVRSHLRTRRSSAVRADRPLVRLARLVHPSVGVDRHLSSP